MLMSMWNQITRDIRNRLQLSRTRMIHLKLRLRKNVLAFLVVVDWGSREGGEESCEGCEIRG